MRYIQETKWWKESERATAEAFNKKRQQAMDSIIIEAFTVRQGIIRKDAQHEG
jgi:hypothetical protein